MDYLPVLLLVFALIAASFFLIAYLQEQKRRKEFEQKHREIEQKHKDLIQSATSLTRRIQALSVYENIENTEVHIAAILAKARFESDNLIHDAEETARKMQSESQKSKLRSDLLLDTVRRDSEARIETAKRQAQSIIQTAEEKAREILGDAYSIKEEIETYERTLTAIKNAVQGGKHGENEPPPRSVRAIGADLKSHPTRRQLSQSPELL